MMLLPNGPTHADPGRDWQAYLDYQLSKPRKHVPDVFRLTEDGPGLRSRDTDAHTHKQKHIKFRLTEDGPGLRSRGTHTHTLPDTLPKSRLTEDGPGLCSRGTHKTNTTPPTPHYRLTPNSHAKTTRKLLTSIHATFLFYKTFVTKDHTLDDHKHPP